MAIVALLLSVRYASCHDSQLACRTLLCFDLDAKSAPPNMPVQLDSFTALQLPLIPRV
jgi:hypothetical protein